MVLMIDVKSSKIPDNCIGKGSCSTAEFATRNDNENTLNITNVLLNPFVECRLKLRYNCGKLHKKYIRAAKLPNNAAISSLVE